MSMKEIESMTWKLIKDISVGSTEKPYKITEILKQF